MSNKGKRQHSYLGPSSIKTTELAPPIRIVEWEEFPDNLAVMNHLQEIAFEAELKREQQERQKGLEAEPKFQKPSARVVEQSASFAGADSFESWLSRQPKDVIEEFEAA